MAREIVGTSPTTNELLYKDDAGNYEWVDASPKEVAKETAKIETAEGFLSGPSAMAVTGPTVTVGGVDFPVQQPDPYQYWGASADVTAPQPYYPKPAPPAPPGGGFAPPEEGFAPPEEGGPGGVVDTASDAAGLNPPPTPPPTGGGLPIPGWWTGTPQQWNSLPLEEQLFYNNAYGTPIAPERGPLPYDGEEFELPDGSTGYYYYDAAGSIKFQRISEKGTAWEQQYQQDILAWQKEQQLAEQAQWEQEQAWQEQQWADQEAYRQQQLSWQEQQFQQEQAFEQQQFAWMQQQATAQQTQQQQNYLANLQANPASWLEYAGAAGTTPAIQPWMIPLMGQEYAGTVAGAPLPGWEGQSMNMSQLPELTDPSRQYQARMGPTAFQQYAGYQQAATGIPPTELEYRLWSQAPPGGGVQSLGYVR
uniref:Uncharacterized protein n=1 Tax=viral metagenome TaxID=1070528 RepID=A0A6M3ITT4_9ZZZZ